MPAVIIAPVQITRVEGNATVIFGDTLQIAPKFTSKTYQGSGSSNTGIILAVNNVFSSVNTLDNDVVDDTTTSVN